MKQRIEDLGRIAERLRVLLDHDLFEAADGYNKHKEDPYETMREYTRDDDALRSLMVQLSVIKNELYAMYQTARWSDDEDGA